MPERSRSAASPKRLLALVVLLVAAYLLFRVAVGVITGFLVTALVVAALVAVVWAYSTLKRR